MPKRQENPVCERNIIELTRPFQIEHLENAVAAIYREARHCGFSVSEVDKAWQYGRKLAGVGVTV